MNLPTLKWAPSPNFSKRTAPVYLIVIHDLEGCYKPSIAEFEDKWNHGRPVSCHFVLKADDSEVTQMVRLADKAWHCCNFNSRSVGLEMEGFEKKGFSPLEWGAAEKVAAYLAHRLKIPVQWAQHGAGPGICRHLDLGAAGGGHTDPTLDLKVWQSFIAGTKAAYDAFAAHGVPAWGER